jgi:hypothetical protein
MSCLWCRKENVQTSQGSRFGFRRRILNYLVDTLTRRRTALKACSETIKRTLDIVQSMLKLADEGDAVREDVGCGILYAVLRDSAYKIKKLAEAEREAHAKKGWWGE